MLRSLIIGTEYGTLALQYGALNHVINIDFFYPISQAEYVEASFVLQSLTFYRKGKTDVADKRHPQLKVKGSV